MAKVSIFQYVDNWLDIGLYFATVLNRIYDTTALTVEYYQTKGETDVTENEKQKRFHPDRALDRCGDHRHPGSYCHTAVLVLQTEGFQHGRQR